MIFGEITEPGKAGIDLGHPVWKRCWEWLRGYKPGMPLGIEEFGGERFFANLHEYNTKESEECLWEAHKHTIDLQVVLDGGEFIEYLPEDALMPRGSYDSEKERWIYEPEDSPSRLHLTAGRFAVFFPGEPHRPQISDGENRQLRKVVFKIHEEMLTQSR